MTVSSISKRVVASGNGTSLSFFYPYHFFSPGDLAVSLFDAASQEPVAAPVLNGAGAFDYVVNGTLDSVSRDYPGGAAVVFNSAPPLSYDIIIDPAIAALQQSSFADNTLFPAKSVERGFDRLTLLIQQLLDSLSRTLSAPLSDPAGLNYQLPGQSARAGLFLGFDGSGNLVVLPSPALEIPQSAIDAAVAIVIAEVGGQVPVPIFGNWVPQFQFGTAPPAPAGQAQGKWYRFGQMVYIEGSYAMYSRGFGTGAATFANLPFTAANYAPVALNLDFTGIAAPNGEPAALVSAVLSGTGITFLNGPPDLQTSPPLTQDDFSDNAYLHVAGWYRAVETE